MDHHTQPPLPSFPGLSVREAAHSYVGVPPQTESPLQRLRMLGAGALSTAELLALLGLSLPDAQHLVSETGSLLNLARSSSSELVESPGVGPALAARIQAAVELGKRVFVGEGEDAAPRIQCPADLFHLLQDMALLEQEEMRVVPLDIKSHVIRVVTLYRGNVNSINVRVAEVLRIVIQDNAPAFVLAHNHPTGDATPSPEDVVVTRQLATAAKQMDLDLLDHLIIGKGRFVSLKERGLY
jgi:DNA repair protein RadC